MRVCQVIQEWMLPNFCRRHQTASAPYPGQTAPAYGAYLVALFVIFVWGVTFVNTRALLADFSALEILVVRFALAWGALWGWERIAARPGIPRAKRAPKEALCGVCPHRFTME